MRKLILIPEYRPLWAMQGCFGPTHGPLTKPCPTPIDIIGKLLLQSGKEALTIYEVIPDPEHKGRMLPPIQLTLQNYKLSYEEIAGIKEEIPDTSIVEPVIESTPVEPTIVLNSEPEVDENPAPEEVETENIPETAEEFPYATSGYIAPVDSEDIAAPPSDNFTTETNVEVIVAETNPYAGMTKAERRRARREREAALAAANQNAATDAAETEEQSEV